MGESSRQNLSAGYPKQNVEPAVGLNSFEQDTPGVLYCQHLLDDGRAKQLCPASSGEFLLAFIEGRDLPQKIHRAPHV